MESDDDFLPPTQFSQYRGSNLQAVTSTSRPLARDMPGPSRLSQPSQSRVQPSQSRGQPSQSEELSQIQDGLKFLMERVQQLSGDRGIKRPGEQKPFDKRSDTKEQCQLCKKFYANKTTLFRHYRAMHQEMNPEKYHGCTVNSTVVSLDVSLRENTCGVCEYVAASQNALDAHNRDVHSNVVNANSNNANTRAHSNASNSSNVDFNRTNEVSVANKENISNNAVINKLHKCEECACYFEERNKFDEHMKVQHGFEVVCKICNRNFLFKDIDGHVKDSHPDVYNYKINKEKHEKVIIEKVMKNKKGNRVHVFVCTKCDFKMVDKIEADKHARGHKKGLKIKVGPRAKVTKHEEHFADVTSNDHVILTCADCDVSTGSYDAAVEHAQNHITNNSNDIVTQQCQICKLKFEPLCYKKHIDLHYNNKEIHKESFKYFKYRYQILLSENWFYCFSRAIPELKKMIDESIYKHTRSVKMRDTQGGTFNLYKCCQCDNYVEPAAVLNHTLNYDTCVKVKCSYSCDICERQFNNRLARNNHIKDHKCEDNYKTVLFNHENDKEFNKMLNDPSIRFESDGPNSEEVIDKTIDNANAPKVLYKCLCGICFVRKENADVHKKICPGKDPKKSCPKCNNSFNPEELLAHCFEHHLNQTQIVIEHISPDVIVIESDEESENNIDNNDDIIEIVSSDEEDVQTERFDHVKIEVLKPSHAETISEDEPENQNMNASNAITEAGENVEQVASEANLLIEKSVRHIDEDVDRCEHDFGGMDEMTDEDSQDTITYENTETATAVANPAVNKQDKVKCVPMNLLLNPLHFEMNGEDRIGVLNPEIAVDIESIRQQFKTTDALCTVLFDATIKKENSWFDPTDFSNIRSRRSLRQTETPPASINFSQEVIELLLTDDEETEMNHDEDGTEINDNIMSDENNDILNEGTEKNDTCEDPSISNTLREQSRNQGTVVNMNDIPHAPSNEDITTITQNEVNLLEESVGGNNVYCEANENYDMCEDSSIPDTLTEQSRNQDTIVNMNDIPHAPSNEDITTIAQNEVNHVKESVGGNNIHCEAQPELANINGQGVTNDPTHSSHEEAENNVNNDQYYSDIDDDLFIPSGIQNLEMFRNTELNNNEKEVSKAPPNSYEDQVALVNSANNKSQSSNTIKELGSIRFEISVNNTSTCVENTHDDTETNDIRSDETNDILNTISNEKEIDKEVNRSDENNSILNTNTNQLEIDNENATTAHFQPNHEEDTQDLVEPTPNEASTVINNIAVPEEILREEISIKQTDVNITKEFDYTRINVKREMVEENVPESENGCDKEVRIKTEPMEYNENKENDIFVIKNADNGCSIC